MKLSFLKFQDCFLDGYLYQTTDKYSVTHMSAIEPLKDPNRHVLIQTYKDKESERQTKSRSRKSADFSREGKI